MTSVFFFHNVYGDVNLSHQKSAEVIVGSLTRTEGPNLSKCGMWTFTMEYEQVVEKRVSWLEACRGSKARKA
jgi:hypothetical protein